MNDVMNIFCAVRRPPSVSPFPCDSVITCP